MRRSAQEALIERLRSNGAIRTDGVLSAMADVDRRDFLPDGAGDPYRDAPVVLQLATDGRPLSTASQPTMVALMLEQLAPRPRDRILEIGTASGYNAALLAHLVGEGGTVHTLEIEPELAGRATDRLRHLQHVHVICGDGRAGHPDGAPFDRIIVTAGAPRVLQPWSDQLVEGGRLVVPVTGPDGHGVCITFEKLDGELCERSRTPCGFVPLRTAPD